MVCYYAFDIKNAAASVRVPKGKLKRTPCHAVSGAIHAYHRLSWPWLLVVGGAVDS